MKTNKKIYGDRKSMRLQLEIPLASEVLARSRQQRLSMTAYIARAIVRWIEHERKFE